MEASRQSQEDLPMYTPEPAVLVERNGLFTRARVRTAAYVVFLAASTGFMVNLGGGAEGEAENREIPTMQGVPCDTIQDDGCMAETTFTIKDTTIDTTIPATVPEETTTVPGEDTIPEDTIPEATTTTTSTTRPPVVTVTPERPLDDTN